MPAAGAGDSDEGAMFYLENSMKKILLIGLVFLFVSATDARAQSSEKESFTVANRAFLDGLYSFAHARFSRYVKDFPQSPNRVEAYLKMGISSFHTGKHEQSNKELDHVLQHRASSFFEEAQYWKLKNHFALKNWQDALQLSNALIKKDNRKLLEGVYVYKGKILYYNNKFDQAVVVFDKTMGEFSKSAFLDEIYFFKGKCFYESGKFAKGAAEFEMLLRDLPESTLIKDAWLWLAECRYCMGQWDKSIQSYEKVLTFDDVSATLTQAACYGLGWSYFKRESKGDIVRSETYFRRIIREFPESEYVDSSLFKLGQCLERQDKYAEAIACFEKTMDNKRYRYQSLFLAGICTMNQGHYKKAGSFFQRAMKTPNPAFKEKIRLHLGISLYNSEEYDQAEKQFETVWNSKIGLDTRLSAKTMRAACFYMTDRYYKAITLYEDLIKDFQNYPKYMEWIFKLAQTYVKLKQHRKAVKALGLVKPGLDRWDEAAFKAGTLLLFNLNEYEKASKVFQQIASRSEDRERRVNALYYGGVAIYNMGEYEKAAAVFEAIIRDHGTSRVVADAYYQLGQCLENLGKNKKAIEVYTLFLEKYPSHERVPVLLLNGGQIAMYINDDDTAFSFFHKLITRFSNSEHVPEAMFYIGNIADRRGQKGQAEQFYQNIAGKYPKSSVVDDALYQLAFAEAARSVKSRDMDKALALYSRLVKDYPDSNVAGKACFDMAVMYESLKKTKKAIEFYEKAVKGLGAEKEKTLSRLASLLYSEGTFEKAANRYMELIYLFPNSSRLEANTLQAARCFIKLKNKPQALKLLEKKKDLPGIQKYLKQLQVSETAE